jgi:hypothetical protein
MSIRMRRPETDRLDLTQGDHLVVKRDLTAGEFRDYLRASTKPGAWELDPLAAGMALVLAYLLDWSFQDADGKPLVITDQPPETVRAVLDHLDHESYMEVQRAVQAHQAAREAARGVDPTGATAPAAT